MLVPHLAATSFNNKDDVYVILPKGVGMTEWWRLLTRDVDLAGFFKVQLLLD